MMAKNDWLRNTVDHFAAIPRDYTTAWGHIFNAVGNELEEDLLLLFPYTSCLAKNKLYQNWLKFFIDFSVFAVKII